MPSILFLAWNPGLFRGEAKIPKRTFGLLIVTAALNAAWFIMGWRYGMKYQGHEYVRDVIIANVIWFVFVGLLFVRFGNRNTTFLTNLALHWFLFAWLAWYAFPYLGELP